MWKLLLKKQMQELFKGYFFNPKNNQKRSTAAVVGMFLLYAVVMFGVLGGMFATLSVTLCPPLTMLGLGWLFFALLGLIASFLGIFGSVFSTYSQLYLAKDNDFLFSMPIPVSEIMKARLLSVYLLGLLYSGVATVPAVIVHLFCAPFSVLNLIGGLVFILLVSLFVFLLSCVLGWVVAKVSLKLKNKSMITVLISLVFIGAYYFCYYRAQVMIQDLLNNAELYGAKIKGAAYGLYLFGRTGEGDILAMLVYLAVFLLLAVGIWNLIKRSFLKLATSTGKVKKAVYRERTAKQRSILFALTGKELKRFLSSPNYMLNCGMGILILVLLGGALIWKGAGLSMALEEVFEGRSGMVSVLICAGIIVSASMNYMATPSVSLEGKNLWIVQSLPVTAWQALNAKLTLQILLTGIPVLIDVLVAVVLMRCSLLCVLLCLLAVVLFALFDLFLGVKMPNLHWTNETVPIKQSFSVFIAMIVGMLYSAAIALPYLLAELNVGAEAYLLIWIAVTAVLSVVLYLWLKKKGSAVFAAL